MSKVATAGNVREHSRPERHLWYYLAMGLVAGAAVIEFAVLPQQFAGLALVVAAVVILMIDSFFRRRFSVSRFSRHMGKRNIIYLVIVVVVLISAVLAAGTVARNGYAPWLAWVMAFLLFVVIAFGTLIVEERPTHEEASAT